MYYFLPRSLMAKVAPKIIDRKAVPQKITMKEPAKGVKENPSNGTNAL
tara:strand:- start:9 stop:152 length:144 start_codon:yes stop_codon:yes gene_type:complete